MAARANDWRRFAAIMAVVAVIVALYWPTIQSLTLAWEDTVRTTYTHGYLIVLMSLWFAWRARDTLTRPDPRPWSPAQRVLIALALAGVVLTWQLMYRAGIQIGCELLLPVLLWIALLALFGRFTARAAVLPLGYLLFAIPFWDFFTSGAQWATTKVVQILLRVFGVPAYFSGNHVQIPAGDFEIAGGCSGLHYLIVALALAVFLGELRRDGWRLRLRWCLVALLAALVVNWLRVFIIILAGHLSHMQNYLVRESHYGFGWSLFLIVVITLYLAERRVPAALPAAPGEPQPPGSEARAIGWRAAMGALLALPLAMNWMIRARTGDLAATGAPATASAGCQPLAGLSEWRPQQHFADRESRTRYRCDGVEVEGYSAWYREQHLRKKLGGYDNRLQGEVAVAESRIEAVNGRRFQALRLQQGGRSALLWVTYRVAGREFTDPIAAQFWYSFTTMFTLRSPVSLAAAARADCAPDCDRARAVLERFANEGGIP